MHLLRLIRTLRHLRGRQIVGQLGLRLGRRARHAQLVERELPPDGALPRLRFEARGEWLRPDAQQRSHEAVMAGRLSFVGVERECGMPLSWSAREAPRLWRYNLHYHGFLFDLEYEQARELVEDYIRNQPASSRGEGWEPYPLSLRSTHWIALFWGRWRAQTSADPDFERRLWLELRRMMAQLERQLEFHLMANHLLENAIALCLAGSCFQGALAARWRMRGVDLLQAELAEQILPDGLHYERSPMYQARILYALGLLWNSGDDELAQICGEPMRRMAAALEQMTHPDGGIALFNDSALDVYPATAVLLDWLHALGALPARPATPASGATLLAEAGYFAARNEHRDAVFMDVGEIGPAHQPGHAHADFLSIEASFGGQRLIVDGGNKEYEAGADRQFARSVCSHSTVYVEGEEPLELWGSFRVGRRGRAYLEEHVVQADGAHSLRASQDGYAHLPGRPLPQRSLRWDARGAIELRDCVLSRRARACISQLIVDAAWTLERIDSWWIRFSRDGLVVELRGSSPIEIEPTRYFPRMGQAAPAHRLLQRLISGPSGAGVGWALSPVRTGSPALTLEEVPSLTDRPAPTEAERVGPT